MTTKTKNPLSDPKLYDKLKAPFPKEAFSKDTSRGFALTSIKAQFVKERLNEVFGPFGWGLVGDSNELPSGVLFKGELQIYDRTDGEARLYHRVEAEGFAGKKKNHGDTVKSARTDCLSKAASSLGIGNEVFKGEVNLDEMEKSYQNTKAHKDLEAAMKALASIGCTQQDVLDALKVEHPSQILTKHLPQLRRLYSKLNLQKANEELKNAKSE